MAIINLTPIERAFAELNAVQLAVLRAIQVYKLLALMLPRQVGKTHLGIWMIREVMRQDTNAQTMFLAKDFPSIKRNTQEKFLKLFPGEEFNVTTAGVNHHNPAQDRNRGACFLSGVDKNPHKIRGGTMAMVHWSEAAFSKFEGGSSFRDVHQTVVLPTLSRTQGYYLIESTPFGSNFWKEFWEDGDDLGKGFTKIVFPLELCIALGAITRAQADFMEGSMHPDVFRQEMLCQFVSFMGKIYTDYDEERHDCAVEPEPHERVILGIDIGHTAGFSCLFAVWRTEGDKKRLYIFDQIYQKGLRIGQMVNAIEERIAYWKIPKENYSAYTDHDVEMVEELTSRHIKVTLADKIDPFACRLAIKEGLYLDGVRVNRRRCSWLNKELQAAAWSEKKADEMDERGDPNAGHWDSEASLRYLYRGSKLENERPDEAPAKVKGDAQSLEEWERGRERRAAKKEREKASGGEAEVFEY